MAASLPPLKDAQKRCEAFLDSLKTPGCVIFGYKQAGGSFGYTYAVRRMPKVDVAERIAWVLESYLSHHKPKKTPAKRPMDEVHKRAVSFIEELGVPAFIVLNWRKEGGDYRTVYSVRRTPRETVVRGLAWALGRHLRKKQ